VLWHAFLPALSLTVLGWAIWFQTMKLIVQNVNAKTLSSTPRSAESKKAGSCRGT